MKIVNRDIFLTLPSGVLYSKFNPDAVGPLCIKGDTIGSNDFACCEIADISNQESNQNIFDYLIDNASYLELTFTWTEDKYLRDGLFDSGQLFLVWDINDMKQLCSTLMRNIKKYEEETDSDAQSD